MRRTSHSCGRHRDACADLNCGVVRPQKLPPQIRQAGGIRLGVPGRQEQPSVCSCVYPRRGSLLWFRAVKTYAMSSMTLQEVLTSSLVRQTLVTLSSQALLQVVWSDREQGPHAGN